MAAAINAEIERLKRQQPDIFQNPSKYNAHMEAFQSGLWNAYIALSELSMYEAVAYNKRSSANPDHW